MLPTVRDHRYQGVGVSLGVGVSVAVDDGVKLGVRDGVSVGVGVDVCVEVLLGMAVCEGAAVAVNVTSGSSIGLGPSRSERIQPPSYCRSAGSVWPGATKNQTPSSFSFRAENHRHTFLNVPDISRTVSSSPNGAYFWLGPERT